VFRNKQIPSWLTKSKRSFVSGTRAAPDGSQSSSPTDSEGYASSTNLDISTRELVRPILQNQGCLIVTGYQDFLGAMQILLQDVPTLNDLPAGSIRLLFGVNTDNRRHFRAPGLSLSEEARNYFLEQYGVRVDSPEDMAAVFAKEAISKGIIELRIFDREVAKRLSNRSFDLMHAKLYVSTRHAMTGSSNFTAPGLSRNFEFNDRVGPETSAYRARAEAAEDAWEFGRDWTQEALEILERLLRWVSPEDAMAKVIHGMTHFEPWLAKGSSRPGMRHPPLQMHERLIHEAMQSCYEYGFAVVESPTGSGKTGMGMWLGSLVPETVEKAVPQQRALGDRRQGAIALVPPGVKHSWTSSSMKVLTFSDLTHAEDKGLKDDLARLFAKSSALIVDESHELTSSYQKRSKRSRAYDESPAILSTYLTATPIGNRSNEAFLDMHEKRASLYCSPHLVANLNKIIEEEEAYREDTKSYVISEDGERHLAEIFAPMICRRSRSCFGESATREVGTYPVLSYKHHMLKLSVRQKAKTRRLLALCEGLESQRYVTSKDHERISSVTRHHKEHLTTSWRILSGFRQSSRYALTAWSWNDGNGDKYRQFERGQESRSLAALQRAGQMSFEFARPDPKTPISDEIESLLLDPDVQAIDDLREEWLVNLAKRHRRLIVLSINNLPLHIFANRIAGRVEHDLYALFDQRKEIQHLPTSEQTPLYERLSTTKKAEDVFRYHGGSIDELSPAILFMNFKSAVGLNLQTANATVLLCASSDIKSTKQGTGRTDRIDSPHPSVYLYTSDLPNYRLSSDDKATARLTSYGIAAGGSRSDLAEYSSNARDIVGRLVAQMKEPRKLRHTNLADLMEMARSTIDKHRYDEIAALADIALWGADLTILRGSQPFTMLYLRGVSGELDSEFMPPRLISITPKANRPGYEVDSNQVSCGVKLMQAYEETCRLGGQSDATTSAITPEVVYEISREIGGLKAWDIRPERMKGLLSSLAAFYTGASITDDGYEVFGDLSLSSLELLSEAWLQRINDPWVKAKQGRYQADDATLPRYLSHEEILTQMDVEHRNSLEDWRPNLEQMVEDVRRRVFDHGLLRSRVSVIFHCRQS
jgi:hypothetical protein